MQNTIKLIVVVVLMGLMIAGSAVPVAADEYDQVVTGTGDPAVDVPAVQAAVDQGGKILLKGTFDFGDLGTVAVLTDDVEIHGEKRKDSYDTKIIGGQIPFLVGSTATGYFEWLYNPDAIVPVNNIAIQDIYFENPMIAVAVLSCHGELGITGNKIVDGRPYDFYGYPLNMGIYVGSVGANYDPTVVTADVTIAGNTIDGMGRSWAEQPADDPWAVYDPDFDRWYRGLVVGFYVSNANAHMNIVGNEIVNTLGTAITVMNWPALSEHMTVRVGRNTLIPNPSEYYGDPLDVYSTRVHVSRNTTEIANPNSWGLACASCYDSVIEKNNISYHGFLGGISLLVTPLEGMDDRPVSGNLVRNNTIAGEAPFAVAITPHMIGGDALAENNTFLGNNVNQFDPDPAVWGYAAHYFLDEGANNNLVVGNHGDVIDLGEGNVITGLTKQPGNIGQEIREAMRAKSKARW